MEKIRLQKYLAQCGVASRREAENLILEGKVKVNGKVIDEMGYKIDPSKDRVAFRGKTLMPDEKVYFILNKPDGYVATRRDIFAPKKVTDLVPNKPAVYPVGRLDKDSEGLILMTNDGELTSKLTHPKFHIEKEYTVVNRKRFEDTKVADSIKRLGKGVLISGYLTKPAVVSNVHEIDGKVIFNITIKEGKKHQIRRMCHNVGLKVEKLTRIRMGGLRLGNLRRGDFRALSKKEVDSIMTNNLITKK